MSRRRHSGDPRGHGSSRTAQVPERFAHLADTTPPAGNGLTPAQTATLNSSEYSHYTYSYSYSYSSADEEEACDDRAAQRHPRPEQGSREAKTAAAVEAAVAAAREALEAGPRGSRADQRRQPGEHSPNPPRSGTQRRRQQARVSAPFVGTPPSNKSVAGRRGTPYRASSDDDDDDDTPGSGSPRAGSNHRLPSASMRRAANLTVAMPNHQTAASPDRSSTVPRRNRTRTATGRLKKRDESSPNANDDANDDGDGDGQASPALGSPLRNPMAVYDPRNRPPFGETWRSPPRERVHRRQTEGDPGGDSLPSSETDPVVADVAEQAPKVAVVASSDANRGNDNRDVNDDDDDDDDTPEESERDDSATPSPLQASSASPPPGGGQIQTNRTASPPTSTPMMTTPPSMVDVAVEARLPSKGVFRSVDGYVGSMEHPLIFTQQLVDNSAVSPRLDWPPPGSDAAAADGRSVQVTFSDDVGVFVIYDKGGSHISTEYSFTSSEDPAVAMVVAAVKAGAASAQLASPSPPTSPNSSMIGSRPLQVSPPGDDVSWSSSSLSSTTLTSSSISADVDNQVDGASDGGAGPQSP